MVYAGMDVHKRVCNAAVVNYEGKVVNEFSFRESTYGFEGFFVVKVKAIRERVLVAV